MGLAVLAPLAVAIAAPLIAKQFGPKAPKAPKFAQPAAAEAAKTPKFADTAQRDATVARRKQSLRQDTLLGGGQQGLLNETASTTSLLA